MKKRYYFIIALVFLFLLLAMFSGEEPAPSKNGGGNGVNGPPIDPPVIGDSSRSFLMGFSTWPPGPTLKDVNDRNSFLGEYGDITLVHLDNGVPWVEALAGEEYSDALKEKFSDERSNIPRGNKLFVAITPLSQDRQALAPYYGESEGMELPSEWKGYELNDENVKKAYLDYAQNTIKFLNPNYLAIGIEVNQLPSSKWPDYVELHSFVYDELKKDYPSLPIFTTVVIQEPIVPVSSNEWLMEKNDILALSTYPHVHGRAVNENYFDPALKYDIPIAIAETGLPSKDFKAIGFDFRYDEAKQSEFIELILRKANDNDFVFVVNWANIDFDDLLEVIPKGYVRDLGKLWAWTGFQESNRQDKPALKIWNDYFRSPLR
jgi:hypothetical protein